MKKIKHLLTVFLLTALSTFSVAQIEMLPLPPQQASFCGATRGFWYIAASNYTIIDLRVPTTVSAGPQSIAVVKFNGNVPPPAFPGTTLAYTTEVIIQGDPSLTAIPVNIPVTAGDVVGIYGSRNGCNAYGTLGPWNTTWFGQPVTCTRSGMQTNIQFTYPFPIWTEAFFRIGLIEVNAQMGGGGGGAQDCLNNQCVTVVCPPDVTVQCIEDFTPDAANAVATSTCGAITGQWVTEPHQTGGPNCDGTTYVYTYKAVDDTGEIGCCEQVVTIANNPPTISVIPGGNVECAADIETDPSDATVTTSCGEELDVTIYAPVITGTANCPNTTYAYTYRVEDQCEREATATRTFTVQNTAPTIQAPANTTCECLGGITPNGANAAVDASCDLGYDVAAGITSTSGPQDCPGSTVTATYTVTDDCGRSASSNQIFTISNGPPVFLNAPANCLILNCEDQGWQDIIQAWLANVKATNSCGLPLTVLNNYNPNSQGVCISNGTTLVTWRATDNCGRQSTAQSMIIINDTEPPVFTTPAQDELDICNYNTPAEFAAWVAARGNSVAVDGCDQNITSNQWSTIPNNPQFPNCMNAMGATSMTVTFVVRDDCGNKSSSTATFTALMAGQDMVEQGDGIVDAANEFELYQNQPNPFSNETLIGFSLPKAGTATLTIYDISGKVVKLVQGDYSEGYNEVQITRSELSSAGMLYYELNTADHTAVKKMIIID